MLYYHAPPVSTGGFLRQQKLNYMMSFFYKIASVDPETGQVIAMLQGQYETVQAAQAELNNMPNMRGVFEIKLYFSN